MRSLLCYLWLFLLGTKGSQASDPALPYMVYMDEKRMVCLEWGFDTTDIVFKLTFNTTGWVGFGMGPNGNMIGADIVIGGMGPDGSYFTDRHGIGKVLPVVDEEQSYTLLSMNEHDGQTTMMFQRAIRSCDEHDYDITDRPIKLIYAYGKTDDIGYHGSSRGTKEVNLLNYMPSTSPADSNFVLVTMDNIAIPNVHTYYHCLAMRIPTFETKQHIYRIDAVIEHPDIVHHILLYRCPLFVNETYNDMCYMGDKSDACFGILAGWAVGGGSFELPEDAGIPIGGDDDEDVFYRLEIHYNNPQLHEGRTDSSGLKLLYTAELREHDVGIMATGISVLDKLEYRIPPKAKAFHTYGVCNTTIVPQMGDPLPDLKVFAIFLHTHLAGRKVRVAQYRNGKQIDFMAVDDHYSFEMQHFKNVGKVKTIKQNDEIAVECTYNTLDRTNVTKMGLSTMDEMCLAFIAYYPASNVASCISHPITALMAQNNNPMSDKEIDEYESLLKNLAQLQIVSSHHGNHAHNAEGSIRKMNKSPKSVCESSNASNRLYTPWIVSPEGLMLLLLWIALM